jgi:hypothetical protein
LARRDNEAVARRRESLIAIAVAALAALATLAAGPQPVAAQAALERLNLDQLQISSLGVSFGRIHPSQVVPTNLYGLSADYGLIGRGWRVVFGTTYWESRFRDNVVQAFADSLQKSLSDTTARVLASPITLYDVTFSLAARYTLTRSGDLRPFIGVGTAAHVINAEGKLIKGTFVERSLDDIAAGVFVEGGGTLRLLPRFGVEGSARADLLSGFRSVQLRAAALYYFGRLHATPAVGSP